MADKFFKVTVTTTKTLIVRVPADDPEIVYPGESPDDVAMEFAQDHRTFSEYIVEELDHDRSADAEEIPAPAAAA